MFTDTRSLGLLAFGVIAILVTWSGVKAIQTNYELQKQISDLSQQNQVQQLQNNNLSLTNDYYKTNEYLELAARRQFGMAAPGEKEYIVPQTVALAHTISLTPTTTVTKAETQTDKPTYQKNFEAWINFFLHRQNNGQ